jgi:hypothetical protein
VTKCGENIVLNNLRTSHCKCAGFELVIIPTLRRLENLQADGKLVEFL